MQLSRVSGLLLLAPLLRASAMPPPTTAAKAATTTTMTNVCADGKESDALNLRVITFNIRYAASASTYEKPWSVRGPLVIDTVSALAGNATAAASAGAIPIIGMQEVLHEQIVDIASGLGGGEEGWKYIGTGRDDGKEKGEYCPIWYKTSQLNLISSTQKWLSPTPDKPSYWPGAGSRRYVIVGVFEIKDGSGEGGGEGGKGKRNGKGKGKAKAKAKRFIAANTHLDNASSEARSEGVKIVLKVIRDVQQKFGPGLPVTLSGDFNSQPGEDAYKEMVSDGYLKELYDLADEKERFGPYETYTGFVPKEVPDVSQRIDFVWIGPQEGNATTAKWDVKRYEVVDNVVGGVYMSDHRPVFGDISLSL
jgi:hypothetical protein